MTIGEWRKAAPTTHFGGSTAPNFSEPLLRLFLRRSAGEERPTTKPSSAPATSSGSPYSRRGRAEISGDLDGLCVEGRGRHRRFLPQVNKGRFLVSCRWAMMRLMEAATVGPHDKGMAGKYSAICCFLSKGL